MSNKNWISLRNAVVRLHDPEERRSDREIEISHAGWPKLNFDQDVLDQFLYAAVNRQIQARGLLTKICINENEEFVPIDNREHITRKLDEDRSFKANSEVMQSRAQYPFVIGRAIETRPTIIPASFWQKHGQMWEQNELVGFERAPPVGHAKKLKPSFEMSSYLAALGLESNEYMQTHDMPEIYLYEQVDIEENSLKFQSNGSNQIVDGDNFSDRQESQKGRGAKRDERWPDIFSIIEEFISTKEQFARKADIGLIMFRKLDKKYFELQKKNPEKKFKIKEPMDPYGLLNSLQIRKPNLYNQIIKQIRQKSK